MQNLKQYIRTIPNFPTEGILFYDISTLLINPKAWHEAITSLSEIIKPMNVDFLVSLEARGFLLSSALSYVLNKGTIMVRKPHKLPGKIISHSYNLEYANDTLEIQTDIVPAQAKVVIIDDVLATSGSIYATDKLLKQLKLNVLGAVVLIEIVKLKGRDKLTIPVHSILKY